MSTQLENLLSSIDPARTYDPTFARANNAVNSFEKNKAQITSRDEFRETLTAFFCHVEGEILKINCSVYSDTNYQWGRSRDLLYRIYGTGGERTAFDMARTGNEGGLYAVLKALALRMAEEYTNNETSARVTDFIDSLGPDEILETMDEYIKTYGHLLPSEMTEKGAVRIKANFIKVLNHHSVLLRNLRNTGR